MATSTHPQPAPPASQVLGSARATGLAVLRVYANLIVVPSSPAHAKLAASLRAGQAADLALRIRRHNVLSIKVIEDFGELIGVGSFDLQTWMLPTMRDVGIIDVITDSSGKITQIEERVGVAAPILEQVAALWERMEPKPVELCAIASADHAAYCPMTKSDHRAALEATGHHAELHSEAFAALAHVGLLRRGRSASLREDVLWAPYVWGTEAISSAEFIKRLPANEQEALAGLSRAAAERPGLPLGDLGDRKVVDAARHAGLLNTTRVLSGATERSFAFSPWLDQGVASNLTEATHERKLFTAHILNGHRYGNPGTGRIRYPLALVRAMINRGSVAPTTAAQTDYGLLEAAGIVRAAPIGGGQAVLHLVKPEVAEDSLKLLEAAIEEDPNQTADSVESLWIPGRAISPEADRQMVAAPAGEQDELIQSTVEKLREDYQRQQRGETLG